MNMHKHYLLQFNLFVASNYQKEDRHLFFYWNIGFEEFVEEILAFLKNGDISKILDYEMV